MAALLHQELPFLTFPDEEHTYYREQFSDPRGSIAPVLGSFCFCGHLSVIILLEAQEGSTYGGGFFFHPISKVFRNRFIAWKVNGRTLKLLDSSFDYDMVDNAALFVFPGKNVTWVSIFSQPF